MFKSIFCGFCVLMYLLLFGACKPPEKKFDENSYVAHLLLANTTLLVTEVARNLEVPWDLETKESGWIWFTQQKGTISRLHLATGKIEELMQLTDVFYRKSTGLLSMVLHPEFAYNPYVFIHYTYAVKDAHYNDEIFSKIVRYTFEDKQLKDAYTVVDRIPGNTYHNGSRMIITSDKKLWLGTGDAGSISLTQNIASYHGKILRMELDGTVPADNPYPNSLLWSMGHRNIQGIAFGNAKLYASEHGPNNDDEINIIVKGGNYGWPNVEGFCDQEREKTYCTDVAIEEPLFAWTPTVAAAGLVYYDHTSIPEWNNSLLLATLKGQALRVLQLDEYGDNIEAEEIYFYRTFGRIRDVAVGTEGEVYIATSNLDWHPGHQPWMYDSLSTANGDRILKIEIANKAMQKQLATLKNPVPVLAHKGPITLPTENFNFNATTAELEKGQASYLTHCASCHRANGSGNVGQIPPLVQSEWVSGNVSRLIDVTLRGLQTPITVNGIEYHGEMPSYRNLEDREITNILNYIRVAFGEAKGTIVPADIKHQRKGLN
ncbi:PQQ-dependent sugar dehydrogenase [Arenibacter sp. GZD96]|uniref:PQQ-dependent sugar dehydrogenase n=1 Tax=Aurantibrevibacter litoralis TaxID=3106030 RepID=UPI002B00278F|nr:PQQ-dependent sugar dehydrogenase [Arenibacter sp. GZD-96]MEA1787487.1 PQQ-dependent sugar dehydrogenase [Arenibacter sp. GZD-96]